MSAVSSYQTPGTRPRSTVREWLAVSFLTLGSVVLPLLGWIVGVVLLWTSDRWRVGEKLLGTLVWPGGYSTVLLVGTLPTQSCFSVDGGPETCTGSTLPGWSGVPLLVVLVVAPLVVGAFLLRRALGRVSPAGPPRHG